jgi:hypothetical protein
LNATLIDVLCGGVSPQAKKPFAVDISYISAAILPRNCLGESEIIRCG